MPTLIDTGKRLLIDAGERVSRDNQAEDSSLVVEDYCVRRDAADILPRDNQDKNVVAWVMTPVLIDADELCLPAARQSG